MTSTVSLPDGSFGRAMNFTILENRLTTVRTVVIPYETGSPVTKSMEMSDHSLEGMRSGWRSPVCALEDILFRAQTEHASIYSRTFGSIAGHQNLWDMTNIVLLTPGWHESSKV